MNGQHLSIEHVQSIFHTFQQQGLHICDIIVFDELGNEVCKRDYVLDDALTEHGILVSDIFVELSVLVSHFPIKIVSYRRMEQRRNRISVFRAFYATLNVNVA